MAWRGGSDASPVGPPHPSCLQVSKQYILGVLTAPTPDLSWQVWVSVSQGSWQFSRARMGRAGCGGGQPRDPRRVLLQHRSLANSLSPLPRQRTGALGLCLWEDFPGSSRTWGWPGLEKLVTCPTWVSGPLPPFCPRGLRGSHPTNVCKCFEIFLQCI